MTNENPIRDPRIPESVEVSRNKVRKVHIGKNSKRAKFGDILVSNDFVINPYDFGIVGSVQETNTTAIYVYDVVQFGMRIVTPGGVLSNSKINLISLADSPELIQNIIARLGKYWIPIREMTEMLEKAKS